MKNLRNTARIVLFSFLLTFITARIFVFLIMANDLPDLFLHVGGTHVHHLNYGIFLLSIIGAYLLFANPSGRHLQIAAAVYGIGLGLTFDEFGMWLHLGGSYWQRASFDAVTVIAAGLALLVYAPHLSSFKRKHFIVSAISVILMSLFFALWSQALVAKEKAFARQLHQIELNGPK